MWLKVSTPCQGLYTLFLCESRFPHLVKVPTPCFYMSQGFHTLPRFLHFVSMLFKVFTHCHRFLHTFFTLNKVPKPIHLSHLVCFMYITWGNFLGFILFFHLEIQVYTYHMICQEQIWVFFIHAFMEFNLTFRCKFDIRTHFIEGLQTFISISALCEAMVEFRLSFGISSLCEAMVEFRFSFDISAPCEAMVKFRFSFDISVVCEAMFDIRFSFGISALCEAMVEFRFSFGILALCEAMVEFIFSFGTSRPSAQQWLSISLNQGPLRGNGH